VSDDLRTGVFLPGQRISDEQLSAEVQEEERGTFMEGVDFSFVAKLERQQKIDRENERAWVSRGLDQRARIRKRMLERPPAAKEPWPSGEVPWYADRVEYEAQYTRPGTEIGMVGFDSGFRNRRRVNRNWDAYPTPWIEPSPAYVPYMPDLPVGGKYELTYSMGMGMNRSISMPVVGILPGQKILLERDIIPGSLKLSIYFEDGGPYVIEEGRAPGSSFTFNLPGVFAAQLDRDRGELLIIEAKNVRELTVDYDTYYPPAETLLQVPTIQSIEIQANADAFFKGEKVEGLGKPSMEALSKSDVEENMTETVEPRKEVMKETDEEETPKKWRLADLVAKVVKPILGGRK
jgi:hypothetical protein